jgi:hypothetical protein
MLLRWKDDAYFWTAAGLAVLLMPANTPATGVVILGEDFRTYELMQRCWHGLS